MDQVSADESGSSCAPTPAFCIKDSDDFSRPGTEPEQHVPLENNRRPWLTTPLNPKRSFIRVLKLQQGSDNDHLVCELSVVDLDEKPHYEVLSYVWGDATITEEITVAGVPLQATRNLADFLRCLRLSNGERVVWADAICIDQSNQEEKSHQIGLMTDIYRHATDAHVWFGSFNSDACDSGGRQYKVNRAWLMVIDCIRWLLLRPWWSRVWTLQEAVLPK
ncbi:HET-domain-containing protein, partial [Setomelanomma holmii]